MRLLGFIGLGEDKEMTEKWGKCGVKPRSHWIWERAGRYGARRPSAVMPRVISGRGGFRWRARKA